MREHERAEVRRTLGVGARSALAPGEQAGIRRRERVPHLLDRIDIEPETLRKRGLGEPGGDTDAHRPGRQLDQRVAAIAVQPIHIFAEQGRRAHSADTGEGIDGVCQPQVVGRRCQLGPDQRDGLGGIADEIAAEAEKLGIDPLHRHRADGSGFDRRKVGFPGQRRQRPAAIGIGRGAQIIGDQRDLGVTRAGIAQLGDQGGKGAHQASSSSSSRPTMASARALT